MRRVQGEKLLELNALACTSVMRFPHLGNLTAMLRHVAELSLHQAGEDPTRRPAATKAAALGRTECPPFVKRRLHSSKRL